MMNPITQEECVDTISPTGLEHQTRDETSSSSVNSESAIALVCQGSETPSSKEQESTSTSKEHENSEQMTDDHNNVQVQPGRPDCVIDVTNDTQREGETSSTENICRICHLSSEDISGNSVLIKLDCACKGDLATSHRDCAEIWFKHRGSRICEICGKIAKSIRGPETVPNRARIEARAFSIHQRERRVIASSMYVSETEGSCCRNSFCNILLACLLFAFILPWLYHMDL